MRTCLKMYKVTLKDQFFVLFLLIFNHVLIVNIKMIYYLDFFKWNDYQTVEFPLFVKRSNDVFDFCNE